MLHREVYRARDKAQLMRPRVERHGFGNAGGIRYDGARPQYHTREFAGTVFAFRHRAAGRVLIFDHNDAGVRAQVQEPQHVARGERRDQQFFGGVARGVAAERSIGRTRQRRPLAYNLDFVVPRIGAVVAGSRAKVASPGGRNAVVMFAGQKSTDGMKDPAGS